LRGAPDGTFDSALLAGGWNLLSQAGLECFAECEARGVDVHVAGVFASGLLVGGETYAYKQAPPEMSARCRRWALLAEEFGHTLPAVAIAFAAMPACVTRVVLGMATPEQVASNLAWVAEAASVPPSLWMEAKRLGLLGPEVPVPL
jgi:D-threo-aldose 1-dehydrogenase